MQTSYIVSDDFENISEEQIKKILNDKLFNIIKLLEDFIKL